MCTTPFRLIGPLALLASCLLLPAAASAQAPSGFGTAVIDAHVESVEWASARCLTVPVNVPEGVTTPGVVCAMNDATNLYLSLRFTRAFTDAGNSAAFEFDNDDTWTGSVTGDDVLLVNPAPGVGFLDEVRWADPPCTPGSICGFTDVDLGGSNDGAGAFSNDGAVSAYEIRHPLDTADDAHDFSLAPGMTVGISLFVRIIDQAGTIADTYVPQGTPARLLIVTPPLPSLQVGLNADTFAPGDVMTLSARVLRGSTAVRADAYVVLQLAGGEYLSLLPGGRLVPGLVPFVSGFVPDSQAGELLTYRLTGDEPTGRYVWMAALCWPGTLRIMGPLAEAPFAITP
jgi:hypothetical protein